MPARGRGDGGRARSCVAPPTRAGGRRRDRRRRRSGQHRDPDPGGRPDHGPGDAHRPGHQPVRRRPGPTSRSTCSPRPRRSPTGRAGRGRRAPTRPPRSATGSPATGLYDEVGDLAPGESTPYRLSVPRRDLGITGEPGVYWVGVHVLGGHERRPGHRRRRPGPHLHPAGRRAAPRRGTTARARRPAQRPGPPRRRRPAARPRPAGSRAVGAGRPARPAAEPQRAAPAQPAHLGGRPRRPRRRPLGGARTTPARPRPRRRDRDAGAGTPTPSAVPSADRPPARTAAGRRR